MSSIEEDGAISVEGEYVGRISGFRFVPDGAAGSDGKTLKAASLKTVAHEIALRAQAVAAAPDTDLDLTANGDIIWQHSELARLVAGANVLKPRLQLLADDQLSGGDRDAVQLRLEHFLRRRIAAVLEPLVKLAEAEDITGLARGLAFRLVENLGVVAREQVADDVKTLSQEDRAGLRKYGVRFGAFHIFIPALLKPGATQLRLLLWALGLERDGAMSRHAIPAIPGQGLTSVPFDGSTPEGFYRTIGFRICGARAVRIDMLERLSDLIRARVFWKPAFPDQPRPAGSVVGGGFTVIPDMMSLVGCSGEEFASVLRALGFQCEARRVPMQQAPTQQASLQQESAEPETPPAGTETGASVPQSPEPPSSEPQLPQPQLPEPQSVGADAGGPDSGPAPHPASEPELQVGPSEAPAPDAATSNAALPAEAQGAVPAGTLSAEAPAADGAEAVIEVWWPKETGPFRKQGRPGKSRDRSARRPGAKVRDVKAPDAKARGGKAWEGKAREGEPRDGRPHDANRDEAKANREGKQKSHSKTKQGPRHQGPRRETREQAPSDSPFAVLGALKAQLTNRKR